jgi:hypothetical protein
MTTNNDQRQPSMTIEVPGQSRGPRPMPDRSPRVPLQRQVTGARALDADMRFCHVELNADRGAHPGPPGLGEGKTVSIRSF